MHGIKSIELVPASGENGVATRLLRSLTAASSLRAAIAYWCVDPKALGPELISRLSGCGFLCVDIHLPTDIDRLAQMVEAGANVYLYLLHPNPQPGELRMKIPPHLLHTKQLLFDCNDAPSELWVGSHNWTARALTGINVESSLCVVLDRDADLYRDASSLLESIRDKCQPFDLTAVDYYKWLQGTSLEEVVWVLEVRGSASVLDGQRRLTVFGSSEADYRNLKNVDRSIVVSLLDEAAGKEFLYEATVSDTGRTSRSGVDFDARVYAAYDRSGRPKLCGPEVPPQQVRSAATFWATIALRDQLLGESFELPPAIRWVNAKASVADARDSRELRRWFTRPDKPLIQVPASREAFEGKLASHEGRSVMGEVEYSLIRRKAVRATRRNGELFSASGPRPKVEDE